MFINLEELNKITETKYNFSVFDWDKNRGEGPKAGKCLVYKCHINIMNKTLYEIADMLYDLIQKNQHVLIDGTYFIAKSIHMLGINSQGDASIFVSGDKIDESMNKMSLNYVHPEVVPPEVVPPEVVPPAPPSKPMNTCLKFK